MTDSIPNLNQNGSRRGWNMSELTKHFPAKWSHSSGYKNTRHGNKNIVLPVNSLFSFICTTFQNATYVYYLWIYLCIFTQVPHLLLDCLSICFSPRLVLVLKNLKKKTHTHILEQKQHMNPHKMCSISEKTSILTFFCMVWISVSLTLFSFIDSETNIAWNPRNKPQ